MLRVADRSAVKARTQAINQLRSLISTDPEELTATLKPLTRREIVATASSYRPACDRYDPVTTTKIAMRSLARRIHRLNRGGDRQANNALWRIVIVRLACHQPTRDYMDRQLANGKTKREAIRQLKRYVARHIWRTLQHHPLTT